jgi:hypothetical protein
MQCNLNSGSGQQQFGSSAVVVSAAAVRLLLELQLLAAAAVQRQHQVSQQPQQQPTLPSRRLRIANKLVFRSRTLLKMLVRALAASGRSCLPSEVLQQLQMSAAGDSFYDDAASGDALAGFSEAMYVLVTTACGAEQQEGQDGEHDE